MSITELTGHLLAEAGETGLGPGTAASTETADPELRTPETYLGYERAEGFVVPPRAGVSAYEAPRARELDLNRFAYGGRWRVGPESATAVRAATLSLGFQARGCSSSSVQSAGLGGFACSSTASGSRLMPPVRM